MSIDSPEREDYLSKEKLINISNDFETARE
jgi:hypothetical protein